MIAMRGLYPRLLARPLVLRMAACAACLALIAILSTLRVGGGSSMPDLASFAMNWGHQFLYGALAVSMALAGGLRLVRGEGARLAGVLVLTGIVGYVDEVHQGLGGVRDASLWDLGSDLLGAVLALTCASWTARARGRVFEPGPVLFCLGLSLAWNCVPAFLPSPNLPSPL